MSISGTAEESALMKLHLKTVSVIKMSGARMAYGPIESVIF
jgi:hypothetical protein